MKLGRVLRDLKSGDEIIPYAFAFKRDDASAVLDVRGEAVRRTLEIMLHQDALVVYPGDRAKGKYTRPVYDPATGKKESMVVVRDAADPLMVRRIAHRCRYDNRHPR